MSKVKGSEVLFTLASRSDSQPTTTANRLGITASKRNQLFRVSFVGGKSAIFRVNRTSNGSITLMAQNYSGRLPKVGSPITLKVSKVVKVK